MKNFYFVGVAYELTATDLARRIRAASRSAGSVGTGIIVSNSADRGTGAELSDITVLQGTNEYLDFSGYFEGLSAMWRLHPDSRKGVIVFLNDSLFTKHAGPASLARVLANLSLLAQLRVPTICGKVDPYRTITLSNPWSGANRHVTTFCFALNPSAAAMLANLPSDAREHGVTTPNVVSLADDHWATGIPPAFREQIRAHLLYENSPEQWRGSSGANDSVRMKKAHCVYFEHRLSGLISEAGAVLAINAGGRSSFEMKIQDAAAAIKRRFVRLFRRRD